MRKISPNERVLLLVFGGAVFVMANLLLFRWGKEVGAAEQREVEGLRSQLTEYTEWKSREWFLVARREWWEKNPPSDYDPAESDSAFVEQVQQSLTSAGLRIEEQQLSPAEKRDGFVTIKVTLKITGGLENVIRWLTATQKAGNYLEITQFNLKSAEDTSTMIATLELTRFFAPPGALPTHE